MTSADLIIGRFIGLLRRVRDKAFKGLPKKENPLNVFYTENIFHRTLLNRRHFTGLLSMMKISWSFLERIPLTGLFIEGIPCTAFLWKKGNT